MERAPQQPNLDPNAPQLPVEQPNAFDMAANGQFLDAAYRQAAALSSRVEDLTVTDFKETPTAQPDSLPAADESLQSVDMLGGLADAEKREHLFNALNEISLSADTISVEGLEAAVIRRETAAPQQRELEAQAAARKEQDDYHFIVSKVIKNDLDEEGRKQRRNERQTTSRPPRTARSRAMARRQAAARRRPSAKSAR